MKWYTYVICFLLIVVGVFCGIRFYKEVKAESYVNGSIDITNEFSKESFSYINSSLSFYHDNYDETDTYYFEIDSSKVNDFNGKNKMYQVVLNDFVILNSDISAGSVYSVVNMDFYDTNNEIVCKGTLNISIQFLSNKTSLKLVVTGNEEATGLEQSKFFEQYFADNGIRLKVNEIL